MKTSVACYVCKIIMKASGKQLQTPGWVLVLYCRRASDVSRSPVLVSSSNKLDEFWFHVYSYVPLSSVALWTVQIFHEVWEIKSCTYSGAHSASCPMGTVVLSPGGNVRPGRDSYHSPLSSAEVKNEWELY